METNQTFAAMRTQTEMGRRREKALASLDVAVQKYLEVDELVKEGTKFYLDLRLQVVQLEKVITEFCFVRQQRRQEHVLSKGKDSGDFSSAPLTMASSSSAPPPPPLPPRSSVPPPPSSSSSSFSGGNTNITRRPPPGAVALPWMVQKPT